MTFIVYTRMRSTISNLVSNSDLSGKQTGLVTANMKGDTSTRAISIPVVAYPASLELTPLEFNAIIAWEVDVNTDNGFTITGPSSGTSHVVTPPQGFQTLPYQPVMLAEWQQKGSLAIPGRTSFVSGRYPLNQSSTKLSINYKNIQSSTNLLTIHANLVGTSKE